MKAMTDTTRNFVDKIKDAAEGRIVDSILDSLISILKVQKRELEIIGRDIKEIKQILKNQNLAYFDSGASHLQDASSNRQISNKIDSLRRAIDCFKQAENANKDIPVLQARSALFQGVCQKMLGEPVTATRSFGRAKEYLGEYSYQLNRKLIPLLETDKSVKADNIPMGIGATIGLIISTPFVALLAISTGGLAIPVLLGTSASLGTGLGGSALSKNRRRQLIKSIESEIQSNDSLCMKIEAELL